MSTKMIARVWALEDKELEGARLLTLLSLADHANADDQTWPSIATISKKTRVSERQVQRSIQWLEEHGYISIAEKGNGRGNTTLYNMPLKGDICDIKDDMVTPFSEEKVDMVSPIESIKGDISYIKGDIGDENYSHARREPIRKPTKKKSIAADAAPPEWQEFIMGLCNCCYKHTDIAALAAKDKGILLSEAKKIHDKGYTLEDVRKWFATEWVKDWRYGENKNRPTPSQVCSGLPAIRAAPDQAYELAPVNGTNGAMSEAKKSALLTRSNSARSKIRTAQYTGAPIDPQWQQDIDAARGLT